MSKRRQKYQVILLSIFATTAILALLLFLLLPALAVQNIDRALEYLPHEVLLEAGESMLQRFRSQHRFCESPELQKSIDEMLQRLVAHVDNEGSRIVYRVFPVTSQPISSTILSLPGGTILLGGTFISETETSDEVALVLAHEIGHGRLRHAERSYFRRFGIMRASALFWNMLFHRSETKLRLSSAIAEELMFKERNIEEELQADEFAIAIAGTVGFSPHALLTAVSRLIEKVPSRFKKRENTRLRSLEARLREAPPRSNANHVLPNEQDPVAEWTRIKTLCREESDFQRRTTHQSKRIQAR